MSEIQPATFRAERIGTGEYAVELEQRWVLPFGSLFGGAIMAAPLAALDEHTGGRNVVAASCHFLRPGQPGTCVIEIEDVKEGRTASTHRATLHSQGQPIATLLATVGPETEGKPVFADPPPPIPDRSGCSDPRDPAAMGDHWIPFQDVLAPNDRLVRFKSGEVLDEPDIASWLRLADDEPIDAARLALLADNWPPAPWLLGTYGIMTTVELNLHMFSSGHRGWTIGQMRARALFDGLFTVSGTLWTEEGTPIGEWRQVALFSPFDEQD
ncbi:MAG: thioesterase family protein [Nitriliruptorales bacterium]|nr:thioesterase family protein [Nitriliruptorales bacterium]